MNNAFFIVIALLSVVHLSFVLMIIWQQVQNNKMLEQYKIMAYEISHAQGKVIPYQPPLQNSLEDVAYSISRENIEEIERARARAKTYRKSSGDHS